MSRGAAALHGRHAFMADSLHGGPSAPQAGMDADGAGRCACFLGCPFRQELSKTGANLWGINAAQISIHQDIMLWIKERHKPLPAASGLLRACALASCHFPPALAFAPHVQAMNSF